MTLSMALWTFDKGRGDRVGEGGIERKGDRESRVYRGGEVTE